jgi:mitochondrial cardiolipin hydrolase
MIKAMFSPAGGISAEIMRTIGAAASSVDIAAFSFTSTYIANVIKRICKKPGMKVQIVFDKDFADKKTSKLDELLSVYGAKTRKVDLKHGSMHHKFIIVDNTMLFTGSYNFTNDAERNNYENVIKTDIPEIVAAYREEFNRVWAMGKQ